MSAYIYGIKNKKNNLYYIGQTINKSTRKYRHLNDLKNQKHPNYHLQNAYNKYGENYFEFEILEVIEDYSTIKDRENFWIEKIGYYNIDKGRTGFTPKALRNMSEAQIGKASSRRILTNEQVLNFLSIEEFIGDFSRPFSRIISCNRIVPRNILDGSTYQKETKEYLSLSLEERFKILERSCAEYDLELERLTKKSASVVWFLYRNKNYTKKKISKILKKNIRSIDRILKQETLKESYEIYSRLSEDILEKILQIIIEQSRAKP